ncbi:GPW/gp25 family protein [Kaistia nematophila]|uniref:GPW/gp25 family protein n=1 Tax=Kaistia nematophila TaxID=2994654 RepID=A0A9X3E519_9HYPH|nr:GPW/gp25 family protein [Kaistia nematophila]MCX5571482.1 GPW/gp25 family protein [Kaistia nematophila]
MASSGFGRDAGAALSGFDHVRQSIGVILTTPIGSRVMRREFGSELFDLIDRPMTDQVILAIYAAAVMAIARWEPRYAVLGCTLSQASADGIISLQLSGVYYPRGHLGDFTPEAGDASMIIPISGGAS